MPWGLTRFHESDPSASLGISAAGSDAREAPQLSAVTTAPFDSFVLLSRSGQAPFTYQRREPTNLRVRLGARAAQFRVTEVARGIVPGRANHVTVCGSLRRDRVDKSEVLRFAGRTAPLRMTTLMTTLTDDST